jgi:hypothetical protein
MYRQQDIFEEPLFYPTFMKTRSCGKKIEKLPWRRGIMVIASASRTEDTGFKSHQNARFLGLDTVQCCCRNKLSLCVFEKKLMLKSFFQNK